MQIYPSSAKDMYPKVTIKDVMNCIRTPFLLKEDIISSKEIRGKTTYLINEQEGTPLYDRLVFKLDRSHKPEDRGNYTYEENRYRNIRSTPEYSLWLTPSKSDVVVLQGLTEKSNPEIDPELYTDTDIISKGFVKGTGSVWNRGASTKDIDLIIQQYSDTWLYMKSKNFLEEVFDGCGFGERLSIHFAKDALGIYTNYQDLFDLSLLPVNVVEENSFKLFKGGEFEKPLAGRYPNSTYSFVDLIQIVKDEGWDLKNGVYVGKKLDGMTSRWDWGEGKVTVYSDQLKEIEDNLPTIVNGFKQRTDSGSAIGELELYINDIHQNRADASAACSHPNSPYEKDVRLTLYDLFYLNGEDISQKPYSYRRDKLVKLKTTKNVYINQPEYLVHNENDLEDAIKRCMTPYESEGAMLKYAIKPYQFKTHPTRPGMIKIKKTFMLTGRVVDKVPIKGSDKTWTYIVGVDGEKKIKNDTTKR